MKELYTLLHENYVEDGDNMFRFDYSMPFLRWALQPPGSRMEWMVGVRVAQTRKVRSPTEPRRPPAAHLSRLSLLLFSYSLSQAVVKDYFLIHCRKRVSRIIF